MSRKGTKVIQCQKFQNFFLGFFGHAKIRPACFRTFDILKQDSTIVHKMTIANQCLKLCKFYGLLTEDGVVKIKKPYLTSLIIFNRQNLLMSYFAT